VLKKIKQWFSVVSLLLMTSACSEATIKNDNSDQLTRVEASNKTKEINNKSKKIKLLKENISNIRLSMAKQQIYQINNEKFATSTGLFNKGAVLHNLSINQDGVLKGSIVVVMIENKDLSTEIIKFGRSEKIAQATYRIIISGEQNLLNIYQRIKKMVGVKVAELEIDYTPKQKNEIM